MHSVRLIIHGVLSKLMVSLVHKSTRLTLGGCLINFTPLHDNASPADGVGITPIPALHRLGRSTNIATRWYRFSTIASRRQTFTCGPTIVPHHHTLLRLMNLMAHASVFDGLQPWSFSAGGSRFYCPKRTTGLSLIPTLLCLWPGVPLYSCFSGTECIFHKPILERFSGHESAILTWLSASAVAWSPFPNHVSGLPSLPTKA